MSRNLTIDQGNTAAKVTVWDGDVAIDEAIYTSLTAADLLSLHKRHGIERAIYCSVVDNGDAISRLLSEMGIKCTILRSTTPVPLDLSKYGNVLSLGPDRVAAMVGARSLYPGRELLVIDLGTAVTYDRVSADGVFMGGNIAPGVGMRLKALNHFTARLPQVDSAGECSLTGTNTRHAMRGGAIYGVISEITYYRAHSGDESLVTVLAGGWGSEIARMLDFEVSVQRNLVSQGLNYILNNET